MPGAVEVRRLGRIGYAEALELQEETLERVRRGEAPETLFLLEHDPVYTIGRTPDRSSLRGALHLPHPVFEIGRGGQATYHGPGQLVGYPILDLRARGKDLHRHLRSLEGLLVEVLAAFGVAAGTREGLTGVWVGGRKIASIGVGVRHWITMHGFALNVCCDLHPFSLITPCGIAGVSMTSIEAETGRPATVQQAADAVAERFGRLDG